MSNLITLIGKLFLYLAIIMLVADVLTWGFTGTYPNTLGSIVTALVTFMTNLPQELFCLAIDLLYALINIIVSIAVSVLGVSSPGTLTAPACP